MHHMHHMTLLTAVVFTPDAFATDYTLHAARHVLVIGHLLCVALTHGQQHVALRERCLQEQIQAHVSQ